MENERKIELNKLKTCDARDNIERERMRKQEFQDYLLKKQFLHNAYLQETEKEVSKQISETKNKTQKLERQLLTGERPERIAKSKKAEAVLAEVRKQKLIELNNYATKRSPDKKF